MLAAQDISLSAAATTVYQLSEDEHIRQQCEAREDYLKRERGMSQLIKTQQQTIDEQQQEIAHLKALLARQTQ